MSDEPKLESKHEQELEYPEVSNQDPKPEFGHAPSIFVMGLAGRASNKTPGPIGDLWRNFHGMGGAKAVPARFDDVVYCVYCEYESDWTGAYTVLVGCSVPMDAPVRPGMRKIEVPAGNFQVFSVTGELPSGIGRTWAEIWGLPLERRYEADFDRYAEDGSVTVHVGVQ